MALLYKAWVGAWMVKSAVALSQLLRYLHVLCCDRSTTTYTYIHTQIKALSYFQAPDVTTSDHKPVSATFTVPTGERAQSLGV